MTRVILLPAKRSADAVYEYEFVKGKALDWHSYVDRAAKGERAPTSPSVTARATIASAVVRVDKAEAHTPKTGAKAKTAAARKKAAHVGLEVTQPPSLPAEWNGRLLRDFELASALSETGVEVRGDKLYVGKIEIECPYDEFHSNAGDPNDRGCFVVNASQRNEDDIGHQWPLIHCMHAHCAQRRTEDFVAKMLAEGTVTLDLFKDRRFQITRKTVQEIVAERKAEKAARAMKAGGAMT